MKKLLLSVICLIAVLSQANAHDKRFNFGLRMAPAISWLNIDEPGLSESGARMKFNWGFIGAWNFYDNLSLVSGFNINSLGANYRSDIEKYRINYTEFQVPILFQMRTNHIGNLRLHAQIGIGQGVMLNARDRDDNNIRSDVRNFNTAYIVAGGMEIRVLGELSLLAQIKYNGGLTKIHRHYDMRNNFVELAFGVLF